MATSKSLGKALWHIFIVSHIYDEYQAFAKSKIEQRESKKRFVNFIKLSKSIALV